MTTKSNKAGNHLAVICAVFLYMFVLVPPGHMTAWAGGNSAGAGHPAYTGSGMVTDPLTGRSYRRIDWRYDGVYKQVNRYEDGSNGVILLSLFGIPSEELPAPLTDKEYQTKAVVETYLEECGQETRSEKEIAVMAAEFILSRSVYDMDVGENSTSWACLVQKKGTCGSFMNAFHLLTRASGLNSICVARGDHGWNCVQIDGEWYEIDLSDLSQRFDWHEGTGSVTSDQWTEVFCRPVSEERKQDFLWSLYE